MTGNENMHKICAECSTPVEATFAKESYEKYGQVNCRECIRKIEADEPLDSEQAEEVHEPHTEPKAVTECDLLDMVYRYVGNDVLQVFGDTGSGKSQFALECARQAIKSGKHVFYLDTERNLTEDDIKSMKGCEYRYTPILSEIDQICQNLPSGDVVILDSIGFPVLTSYARLNMKQRGDALLKLIAIFGDLKQWAYRNNGVVIVTNQPESEFNKPQNHIFRPFGDKSQFACKEIWRTDLIDRKPKSTKMLITAFRSRSVGHRTEIATMEVNDAGVAVHEVNRRK